jgi:predicted lipoprotein with Yx(FWY)xxD motif
MGINGSTDQGNLGQPDNGTVQQPGDGSDISENLTLGTDANATLGSYLIAYNGMTLYTYAKDSVGTSTCYGQCATNWPPYTVPAGMHLNLQAGVSGDAGTITRADGTTQVTYKGMPLYFYVKDAKSGDTTGQNVGSVWFVVKP